MQTIASESDVKEDLESLPLPELQARLGSSPDGLSQAETQRRLAQYGPNEIAEKNQPAPGIPHLFSGSNPVDD